MLTMPQVKQIRELRYMDGLTCEATAQIIGCTADTVGRYAPGKPGKVPVAPLREAFLASGMTAADVARGMGWVHGSRRKADSAGVQKTLGLRDTIKGGGSRSRRVLVDAETVALMAEVIGLAPWQVLPDDNEMAA